MEISAREDDRTLLARAAVLVRATALFSSPASMWSRPGAVQNHEAASGFIYTLRGCQTCRPQGRSVKEDGTPTAGSSHTQAGLSDTCSDSLQGANVTPARRLNPGIARPPLILVTGFQALGRAGGLAAPPGVSGRVKHVQKEAARGSERVPAVGGGPDGLLSGARTRR